MSSRASLRKQIRNKRRQLDAKKRAQASQLVTEYLCASPVYLRSQHIALYLPVDGELDTSMILNHAWSMNKTCYLPVLDKLNGNSLLFSPYAVDDPLIPNRLNIPEPAMSSTVNVRAMTLDLVLTPAIAFDNHGNRLGMGGGFYDRTFSFLRYRRVWRKPTLLGIGYDFQHVKNLPSHEWDVPLDGFVTNKGAYSC